MDGDNSRSHAAELHPGETRLFDHAGESPRIGERPDALDQIAVGSAIAGHDLAHRRNRREWICVIDLL